MKRIPLMILATGLTFTSSSVGCGDSSNEDNADEVGDGDGDSTGDGDGDETTTGDGDGDGDDTTGDGDGDSTDTGPGDCADPSDPGAPSVVVDANITSDTTWTCDNIYRLAPDTHVYVEGATLTIEPGTTVKGLGGSALVISTDGMIEASGTASAPIVMTSNEDSPAAGDWGGLVLLGLAPNNLAGGIGQAEGFVDAPTYGGNDAAHDCGTLEYLRVEYAGFAISEGNELNGITFYSCGSGTTVSHVQTHIGLDDGFEWFGGGFDADHLVVTGANDDSFDIDEGFQGTLQYLFVHQDPAVGDNGWEISNQGDDFDAVPKTRPTVCNATFVGSGAGGDKSKGGTWKEGTQGEFYASIVFNGTGAGWLLLDDAAWAQLDAGDITMANSTFFDNGSVALSDATMFDAAAFEAWVLATNVETDPGLGSAAWGSPDIMPANDVAGDGTVGTGCDATGYMGAVDPAGSDWTQEAWTNYAP